MPCIIYDSVSHSFIRCYLVWGQDKNLIPKNNQDIFKSNMEITSFKKKVYNFKTSQKLFKDWEYIDKSSSLNKIIGKVLALPC